MTTEEIDIIVEASVEQAVKEFKKLLPAIKKQLLGIQKEFDKVNIKEITANIDMSQVTKKIKQAKKQIKDAFDPNDISGIVYSGNLGKEIKGISNQFKTLKGQKVDLANAVDLSNYKIKLEEAKKEVEGKWQEISINQGFKYDKNSIQNFVDDYAKAGKEVNKTKENILQLKQETEQTGTSQNRLTSFFSEFKGKMQQVNSIAQSIRNIFGKMPNVTKMVTNNIKKMGTGIKSGLGHVLKYAGALLSLRGIYGTLKSSANSWLSSSNTLAKQLSANIEYLRYSLGSVFSSVLQYLINLAYQLMKAIQSVVYAFSGINIFAKATASSMNKTAGSAKKTSNSISSVHSDISNVSDKDSGSGGIVSPSMDLSQMDAQMSLFAQKLYDFFKPLIDSWNTYGAGLIEQVKVTASQIGGVIASVWGSFEKIITNGTVYSILQNILSIIGNIAEAFSNAWNYNGNGDAIVQNLANAFNNLLVAINNIVKSDGFQSWLKWCLDKFKDISEKLGNIDWQPLINALETIGKSIGTIALEILNGLTDVFKWLVENPVVAEILIAIGIAIGVVAGAIGLVTAAVETYNILMPIATAVSTAFGISIGWLIGIIVAIIAVIALVVLAIMNWDSIMNWLKQTVETVINAVVEFFTNLWSKVSFIFEAIWKVISTVFQAIWNIVSPILEAIWQIISTVFQAIWNIVSTILGSVWNVFSQIFNWIWELTSIVFQGMWNIISPIMNTIWNGIKTALSWIQQIWSNVWNGVANIVSNVWNGIWGCIKGVINSILSGIENMVNGVVRGVNWILSGISNVANAIGGLVGMKPINLKLNYVSLPRLAKGNVAYSPLIAQFGEYAGASHNPEITAPQNILRETFDEVLSSHEWNSNNNNSNGEIKQVIFQFGSYRVAMEMENLLRQARRQNGTATVNI